MRGRAAPSQLRGQLLRTLVRLAARRRARRRSRSRARRSSPPPRRSRRPPRRTPARPSTRRARRSGASDAVAAGPVRARAAPARSRARSARAAAARAAGPAARRPASPPPRRRARAPCRRARATRRRQAASPASARLPRSPRTGGASAPRRRGRSPRSRAGGRRGAPSSTPGDLRHDLDGAVVVRRPEPARDGDEIGVRRRPRGASARARPDRRRRSWMRAGSSPSASSERARNGPVQVGAVAANELAAGDDDHGARAVAQEVKPARPRRRASRSRTRRCVFTAGLSFTRLPFSFTTRSSACAPGARARLPGEALLLAPLDRAR